MSESELTGKVALVTGGSRGVGAATARFLEAFHSLGCSLLCFKALQRFC